MKNDVFPFFNFESLYQTFTGSYIQQFGQQKITAVTSKIEHSSSLTRFLLDFRNGTIPSFNDFIRVVELNSYFLLAKQETICLGAIHASALWLSIRKNNGQNITEGVINNIFKEIFLKCYSRKTKIQGQSDFFTTYYKTLNDAIIGAITFVVEEIREMSTQKLSSPEEGMLAIILSKPDKKLQLDLFKTLKGNKTGDCYLNAEKMINQDAVKHFLTLELH